MPPATPPPPPPPPDPAGGAASRPRKRRVTPRPESHPPAVPLERPSIPWIDLRKLKAALLASGLGMLVSLGIHLFGLALLGVTVYTIDRQQRNADPLEVSWLSTDDDEGNGGAPKVAAVRISAVPSPPAGGDPAVKMATPNVVATPLPMANTSAADPTGPVTVKPVDVSGALLKRGAGGGRGGGPGGNGKGTGGDGGGGNGDGTGSGNADTQRAVERSLAWIVRQQQKDGHWSLTGPYDDGGTIQTNTGATALALLALLGDGNTHEAGPHKEAVRRGIEWLSGIQRPTGDLFDVPEQGKEAHFYSHAQGTIALCEALALSEDNALRPAATRAVGFLVQSQNPKLGGWKYRPLAEDGIGDLSVTGWALMALHTARMAKIDVMPETFLLSSNFLDSVQASPEDPSRYRYRPDEPSQEAQDMSMTAEGLLCRQWLGWPREYAPMTKGTDFLLSKRNEPIWAEGRRNVYAWYYTSQTLHNLGGDRWKSWFNQVAPLIVKAQNTSGKNGGSWNPTRPRGAFLEWSHGAGRLYFTVMCTLILETPYRHAPIYGE